MLEYIEYLETGNSVSAGFKKHNFVVYGTVNKQQGFTKMDYLQKIYEQVKSSLDYEERQYDAGLPNSITTDKEGTEFIPEMPYPVAIILTTDKQFIEFSEEDEFLDLAYEIKVRDQYNEELAAPFTISTDIGTVHEGYIRFSKVGEDIEANIIATVEDLNATKSIPLYAYQAPVGGSVDRFAALEAQLRDARDTIAQLSSTVESIDLVANNIVNDVTDTKTQLTSVTSTLTEVSDRMNVAEQYIPVVEGQIAQVQSEVDITKNEIASVKSEVILTGEDLAEVHTIVSETKSQILLVSNELDSVDNRIMIMNNEVESTKNNLIIAFEGIENTSESVRLVSENLEGVSDSTHVLRSDLSTQQIVVDTMMGGI